MRSDGLAAAVAVVGGLVLAVLLFVPFAAVRYRREGRLSAASLVGLVSVTVYGLALWTYTLLPLPGPSEISCRGALTRPFGFVDDIRAEDLDGLADLLRSTALLQVVLNVALFVPLGAMVRILARRGWVVAGLLGFATSLLIETTQLTGIWGVYECAYRYFDVDDLIANTTGALVGSLGALVLMRLLPAPRPSAAVVGISVGRRLVAYVCDLVTLAIVGAVAVVGWRAWLILGRDVPVADIDASTQALVQWGPPLLLEAVVVLGWGRTVGEAAVAVRARARRPALTFPSRVVKLVTGVGAFAALAAWDDPLASWGLLAYVVATVVVAVVAPTRGLSNALAGMDLEVTGRRRPPIPPESAA